MIYCVGWGGLAWLKILTFKNVYNRSKHIFWEMIACTNSTCSRSKLSKHVKPIAVPHSCRAPDTGLLICRALWGHQMSPGVVGCLWFHLLLPSSWGFPCVANQVYDFGYEWGCISKSLFFQTGIQRGQARSCDLDYCCPP